MPTSRKQLIQLALLGGLCIVAAPGATIPGLFNTGVDGAGVPLPNQSAEIHYSLVAPGITGPLRVATSANGFPIGPWLGDDPVSAWIGPNTDSQLSGVGGGVYVYQLTFSLSGFNPSTASISGLWAMDDVGFDLQLNGVSTGNAASGFGAFTPFSISSGFVGGVNTLDFFVQNSGGGPTGLRVELSGTATPLEGGVPEPASFILLGTGVVAFGLFRRQRR